MLSVQLEVTRDLVDDVEGGRSNAQHSHCARGDLGPACVTDHSEHQPSLQQAQVGEGSGKEGGVRGENLLEVLLSDLFLVIFLIMLAVLVL